MAHAEDTEGRLYQNLVDAGCNEDVIDQCLVLARNGDRMKLCKMLAEHRTTLLNTIHKSEKQIDCLDFLVYEINKKYKIGGKQNV